MKKKRKEVKILIINDDNKINISEENIFKVIWLKGILYIINLSR